MCLPLCGLTTIMRQTSEVQSLLNNNIAAIGLKRANKSAASMRICFKQVLAICIHLHWVGVYNCKYVFAHCAWCGRSKWSCCLWLAFIIVTHTHTLTCLRLFHLKAYIYILLNVFIYLCVCMCKKLIKAKKHKSTCYRQFALAPQTY